MVLSVGTSREIQACRGGFPLGRAWGGLARRGSHARRAPTMFELPRCALGGWGSLAREHGPQGSWARALSSTGRSGFAMRPSGLVFPSRSQARAAAAIITALSVQSARGGT